MQALAVTYSSNSTIFVCHCLIAQLFRTICHCENLLVWSGEKLQPIYESFKSFCQFVIASLGHFPEPGGSSDPLGSKKSWARGGEKVARGSNPPPPGNSNTGANISKTRRPIMFMFHTWQLRLEHVVNFQLLPPNPNLGELWGHDPKVAKGHYMNNPTKQRTHLFTSVYNVEGDKTHTIQVTTNCASLP